MSTWHYLVDVSEDDAECAREGCAVIVADDARTHFALGCPVPPCVDPANAGSPCVFVAAGEAGPVCAYCDRPGTLTEGDVDDSPFLPGSVV